MGGPVSLEKSLKVANEVLAAHGLATAIHLEEGSGISRDNCFTARGLAKVLELFAPHADLLHGHDGGMDKTGTMDGIRTLAGYADRRCSLLTGSAALTSFVIALPEIACAFDPYGTWMRPSTGTQVSFYDCGGKLCAKIVAVKEERRGVKSVR
jgi:hypothetical protein